MILASKATLARLGDFADFLQSLDTNPIIIISPVDSFGDDNEGQKLMHARAGVSAANLFGLSLFELVVMEPSPLIIEAKNNLKKTIAGIHPDLLKIISDNFLLDCVAQTVEGMPMAVPLAIQDGKAKCGLIILGDHHNDPKNILAIISNLSPSDIAVTNTASAYKIEHISVIHELNHLRKDRMYVRRDRESTDVSDDFLEFVEELSTDLYTIREMATLKDYRDAVYDFIMARHISAAHGTAPSHCTGLAIMRLLCLDAKTDDYRPFYDAACGFTQKIHGQIKDDLTRKYGQDGGEVEFFGTPKISLHEGKKIVEGLLQSEKFTGLEVDMARLYIQANEEWSRPAQAPGRPAQIVGNKTELNA